MRQDRLAAFALIASGLGLASGPGLAGPAVGQFEVKTLNSEPGEIEFQSQNAYAFGNPRRKVIRDASGELEADDNSLSRQRNALELEFGLTPFLKSRIGIEYEKERREDPETLRQAEGYEGLKLDEYAAEVIWIMIPRRGEGFSLGVVVEYEQSAESGSSRTVNAGPILEYANGPWHLSLNPTLIKFLGGERNEAGQKDEKIDFGYATQLKYHWSDSIELALEAYGTVDRIGGSGGRSEEAALFGDFDQHRIGPVVYWSLGPDFCATRDTTEKKNDDEGSEVVLGIGALFGLNSNTPDTTLKVSLEATF